MNFAKTRNKSEDKSKQSKNVIYKLILFYRIERDEQTAGNASSTLSLKFNEIPGVDEYEVRLFSADGTLQKVFKDITKNRITVNELKPGTGYFIEVRGIN